MQLRLRTKGKLKNILQKIQVLHMSMWNENHHIVLDRSAAAVAHSTPTPDSSQMDETRGSCATLFPSPPTPPSPLSASTPHFPICASPGKGLQPTKMFCQFGIEGGQSPPPIAVHTHRTEVLSKKKAWRHRVGTEGNTPVHTLHLCFSRQVPATQQHVMSV